MLIIRNRATEYGIPRSVWILVQLSWLWALFCSSYRMTICVTLYCLVILQSCKQRNYSDRDTDGPFLWLAPIPCNVPPERHLWILFHMCTVTTNLVFHSFLYRCPIDAMIRSNGNFSFSSFRCATQVFLNKHLQLWWRFAFCFYFVMLWNRLDEPIALRSILLLSKLSCPRSV